MPQTIWKKVYNLAVVSIFAALAGGAAWLWSGNWIVVVLWVFAVWINIALVVESVRSQLCQIRSDHLKGKKMTNETPTIRSLDSRHANKDARAGFNSHALFLTPLPNGKFALCDRTQRFYLIIDEPPTREEFLLFHKLLNTTRMSAEARFLGEPSPAELARGIKEDFREPRVPRNTTPDLNIEIKL